MADHTSALGLRWGQVTLRGSRGLCIPLHFSWFRQEFWDGGHEVCMVPWLLRKGSYHIQEKVDRAEKGFAATCSSAQPRLDKAEGRKGPAGGCGNPGTLKNQSQKSSGLTADLLLAKINDVGRPLASQVPGSQRRRRW